MLRFVGIDHEDATLMDDEEGDLVDRLREGAMVLDQALRRNGGGRASSQRASSQVTDPEPSSSSSSEAVTSPFFAGL